MKDEKVKSKDQGKRLVQECQILRIQHS